jgi:toxin HigB-1
VILSFANLGTEDIFNGIHSKAARATCPENIWNVAVRKLDQIHQAIDLRDLFVPPGNRLEPLTGDRSDQHSIRINERYRVCFSFTALGATDVEIVDYH